MSNDTSTPFARSGLNDCWNKIGVRGDGSCPELQRYVHCRNCPVYSASAAKLLDANLPDGHLDEWTGHFSAEQKDEDAGTEAVVIFRIGAEWLALPTAVFKEVATLRTVHSLPHRRGGIVLGLANVRGTLLVCVSLGELLGLEKTTETKKDKARVLPRRLLVISREGSRLVFPVDEVHGIHRGRLRELKEVPATVAKATATYTKSVLAWRDQTVGCLDDQLLFYTLNRSLG
ncbi:MAG TPA: chemotaxis protein CheW [Burkholderiaceae bacterium]|jgi:chemotaxis-related protein WspD|nr:chemotaxis protein CheW [Burkholderiaceae bacterium]